MPHAHDDEGENAEEEGDGTDSRMDEEEPDQCGDEHGEGQQGDTDLREATREPDEVARGDEARHHDGQEGDEIAREIVAMPHERVDLDRFIRLLQEFKEQTQFIVITHNARTIEAADWIYGVTMEEPGVSRVVGVRLEDALQASGSAA